MRDAQALGDEPVLRHRHVVQAVMRKARAQAVARLAGFAEADDVGDDDEMPRGIERLARAEQLAGQRRFQPGLLPVPVVLWISSTAF